MEVSITGGENLNKVFDDVVSSLEDLQLSIKRDFEDDRLANSKVDRALSSMKTLKTKLSASDLGEEYLGRKRKVLDLVSDLNDPSKLTALGTMQTEFSGILHAVQQMLYKDDPKRAKKVDNLDPMRK